MDPLISTADLAEFRDLAEAQMLDTCTVTRVDPDAPAPQMDPDTLEYPAPARIEIYSGKCRIQIKSAVAASTDSDAGERQSTTQEREWQGPIVGTEGIAVTDVIHMDTVASDAALVGREFTVVALHQKSQATARRLRVVEATS